MYVLELAAVLAASPARESSDAGQVREVPLAVQVAREVLTPELWERTLHGIITQYAARLRAMAEQRGGTVDAGLEDTLRRIYDESFRTPTRSISRRACFRSTSRRPSSSSYETCTEVRSA
jgi:hypothetical protein